MTRPLLLSHCYEEMRKLVAEFLYMCQLTCCIAVSPTVVFGVLLSVSAQHQLEVPPAETLQSQ